MHSYIDNSGKDYYIWTYLPRSCLSRPPKSLLGKRKQRDEIFSDLSCLRQLDRKNSTPPSPCEVLFFETGSNRLIDLTIDGDVENNPGPISFWNQFIHCEKVFTNGILNGYLVNYFLYDVRKMVQLSNRYITVRFIFNKIKEDIPNFTLLPRETQYSIASWIYRGDFSFYHEISEKINVFLSIPPNVDIFSIQLTNLSSLRNFVTFLRQVIPRELQLDIADILFADYNQQLLMLSGDVEENPGPQWLDF
jgi:hypothetical protein